ncbi:hypothetical protein PoB_006142600 [Plakobranchus ocellatus]|uniref:Uncharacterized protein n=1 Tax=Plakobranchus ocellatus TaxID=259542 RepID=A0AAV4CT81_9GAST|nr:hypothetical protein PoB_006142600 [Plakobranchus ocellatus]
MNSEPALRSTGRRLSRVRAPPPALWPDGGHSFRASCGDWVFFLPGGGIFSTSMSKIPSQIDLKSPHFHVQLLKDAARTDSTHCPKFAVFPSLKICSLFLQRVASDRKKR